MNTTVSHARDAGALPEPCHSASHFAFCGLKLKPRPSSSRRTAGHAGQAGEGVHLHRARGDANLAPKKEDDPVTNQAISRVFSKSSPEEETHRCHGRS